MADLTVTTVTRTGVTLPAGSALSDDSNTFDNDGKTMLRLVGSVANVDLTLQGQKSQPLDDVSANNTITVTSTDDFLWGPFPTVWYNNLSGKCTVNVTSGTAANLTVAAVSLLDDFN